MSKKRRSKRTTTGNNADLHKKAIDLYLYKSDVEGAEKWFQKADETGFLLAPAACYQGRLLSIERNDREKSKKCFKKSAE